MNSQGNNTSEKPLRVRRGRVDSVDLFEIKEHELELLENGEPTGIHLNFAIFLFSIAISCILSLATATFNSERIENVFLFTSIIGLLGSLYLFILWWRGRKSIKSIISKIRNRIPSDNTGQSIIEADNIEPVESDERTRPQG